MGSAGTQDSPFFIWRPGPVGVPSYFTISYRKVPHESFAVVPGSDPE